MTAPVGMDRAIEAILALKVGVPGPATALAIATAVSDCLPPSPLPDWVDGFLNRRTDVEVQLRLLATGKRGPIEPAEALELANRLAVPEEFMGRQRPAPWEVAEEIAAAIEPKSPVSKNKTGEALTWAAQVARSMFARPS